MSVLWKGFGAAHEFLWGSLGVPTASEDGDTKDHENDQIVDFFDNDYELNLGKYTSLLVEEVVSLRLRAPREGFHTHGARLPAGVSRTGDAQSTVHELYLGSGSSK